MAIKYKNRIIVNPKIMVGKPIIKGTRITVEFILRLLAQGMTEKDVLENYPHLQKKDIQAVLEYATDTVEREMVFPLAVPCVKNYA